MWTCEHQSGCKDQTKFKVEYKAESIVDSNGKIVESNEPFHEGATWAACLECDARALWISEE